MQRGTFRGRPQVIKQDARIPNKNKQIYAIGDIHGQLDLLERMIAAIARDARGHPCLTVTPGDYIDRGPNSRGVIEG